MNTKEASRTRLTLADARQERQLDEPPTSRRLLWDGLGEPPVDFLVAGAGAGTSVKETAIRNHADLFGARKPQCCGHKRKASSELFTPNMAKTHVDNTLPSQEESPIDRFLRSTPPLDRVVSCQMVSVPSMTPTNETSVDDTISSETIVSVVAAGPALESCEIESKASDSDEDIGFTYRRQVIVKSAWRTTLG